MSGGGEAVRLGMFTRAGFYIQRDIRRTRAPPTAPFVVAAIRRLNKLRESKRRARC